VNTKKTSSKTQSFSIKRDSQLESLLNSEHVVNIEKLAVGGAGVSRIIFKDKNLVCFVPKSVPGDLIKIKVTFIEKNYLVGEILEVLNPGLGRRTAPCKHFDDCGGCPWQHIEETVQVEQKELILNDLFKKFLPTQSYQLSKTVTDSHAFEYRNRIQLKQIGQKIGFFKPDTHDLVDIDDCLIAEPDIRKWFKENKFKLKPADKLKKFELKINSENKIDFYPIGVKNTGLSFSQVNRYINEKLVNATFELLKPHDFKNITEFYAGSGNFTFKLAELHEKTHIDAVELSSDLTKIAVKEIQNRKLQKKIRFYTTKSEYFPIKNKLSDQLIFIDPPRQGCEPLLIKSIAQAGPKFILYISCHPVSLVRDLALLTKLDYHFKINHLQIFDMFPQTDHFETLCLIEKV